MTEQIKVLDEKDKVRKRINIWYGDNSYNAIIHTVKETVGNSIDEINKGKGNTIKITLHEDKKTLTIKDDCLGLPVEGVDKETGTENYKLLTEHLFAGTKYSNGIDGNSDYTVGVNGVHLTVLTRASENIYFEIARPNGNIYAFSYYKGDLKEPIHIIGKTDKTYTKIKYKLDDEVFTTTTFKIEDILTIAEEQASLIDGVIYASDESTKQDYEYKFANGILDLLLNRISSKKLISDNIIEISKNVSYTLEKKNLTDDMKIKICIAYSEEDEDNTQIEFLNGSNLIHHGTIQDGLLQGIKNSFNKFAKQEGLYTKNEKQISKDNILIGLNYIIDYKSFFPIYANQTKFASYVDYYKSTMQQIIEDFFEIYSVENREDMMKLTKQVLINKRAMEKAESSRKEAKKKLEQEIGNSITRPSKFVPCRSKNPNEVEFIVIEGDSSLNSIKLSRDSNIHCILPLKGKPISALKNSLDDLLKNQEVLSIYQVLGCGITYKGKSVKNMPVFDIKKLKVNKLLIATDFDTDGFHIQTLLLGLLYTLSPELIRQGHVYILYTPLYVIRTNKTVEYKGENTKELLAYSETERNSIVKILNDSKVQFKETRFKGLGGLPVNIMAKALSKEHRIMKQITMKDISEAKRWLELFLSDEKQGERKQYIEEYGKEYFDYSLYE